MNPDTLGSSNSNQERFESTEDGIRFGKIAQIFTHAISFSPDSLVKLVTQESSPEQATNNSYAELAGTIASFTSKSLAKHLDQEPSHESAIFLTAAIADTSHVADIIASQHPELDDDELLTIMTHPETIDTVATLALRPERVMRSYITSQLESSGSLSDSGSFIITEDSWLSPYERRICPAAGLRANYQYRNMTAPLPMFKRIIPWATQIYLLSSERQDHNQNQPSNR